MTGFWQILPEFLVSLGALAALFGEFVPGRDRGAVLFGAVMAFAAAATAALVPVGGTLFGGMLVFDESARFIRVGVAALTGVWVLWLAGRDIAPDERTRDGAGLALFSALGGLILASSADLITMYMALELSTMPAYVLAGYRRRDVAGLEGALKYFLLSMLTSLIMLYGLSFLYGISGSTHFADISLVDAGPLGLVAGILAFAGLLAKLSAAPFHYWAPDAYAGAPAASVAFISTVPKIAGAVVLVRLSEAIVPDVPELRLVLLAAAVASMVLGNLAALAQTDMRRLMAYSGVAHSGYLLLALSAATAYGHNAVLFYAVAYALPSLAVMLVVAEEGESLTDLGGLVSRRPAVAWAMLVWMLSLIGIPPLGGFFGKLHLFGAALDTAETAWLASVVLAVLMSVVSAGYYFRVVRSMFLAEEPSAPREVAPSRAAAAAVLLAVLVTVAIGVGVSPLFSALGG